MTKLKKTVRRASYGLVFEAGKRREVIVSMTPPNVLEFRAKGCKTSYALTTEACYCMAVSAHVQALRALRAKERKNKKERRKK